MRHPLKIAAADLDPFANLRDEKFWGTDIDMWESVAKKLGLIIEYHVTVIPNIIKQV